ncbi:MAG: hypothetical protein DMD97_16780 [Candidatus Rokuibacteriota bacterium]|nr:MAG: hypothetical protein DMD94_08130 [Candidatus Rokubacteria bacterium]PYN74800.1 MAG: hypothetical protein DMD97_16780 [Candidatus Rokubacteria bacterium]
MHAPIASQRQRSPAVAAASDWRLAAAASSNRMAATQRRATPTRRGLAAARAASTVITEPLVPHETAASAMRARPPALAGA